MPLPQKQIPLPKGSIPLIAGLDLNVQELGRVPILPDPEIPPIVQDEYQEPLQTHVPPQITLHYSTLISPRSTLQPNTPTPEPVGNVRSTSPEVVQGSLEPSRDELDFLTILSTPARYPKNTAGSSKRSKSTPRNRKIRSSSIAIISFGTMLGDVSDDELSLPTVTYPRIPSAKKAKVGSPNRQCGSAGFRCNRKVCLRCT